MDGMATTCSSATVTRSSVHTSSTIALTRLWGPSGATSTSHHSAARRLGRTRPRVTPRPRRTSGGTGTTPTTPRTHLTRRGGVETPALKAPPCEGAPKRRRRAEAGRPLRQLRAAARDGKSRHLLTESLLANNLGHEP